MPPELSLVSEGGPLIEVNDHFMDKPKKELALGLPERVLQAMTVYLNTTLEASIAVIRREACGQFDPC